MTTHPVPLREIDPPEDWGVSIDPIAIDRLAEHLAEVRPGPASFDYAGIPDVDGEEWARFVILGVSVVWRLWPPDGAGMWAADGLEDASGIWRCFERHPRSLDLAHVAARGLDATFFAGTSVLQDVAGRLDRLVDVSRVLLERHSGSALSVVAGDATTTSRRLTDSLPGYLDRPDSPVGPLHFDKLANLATAMLAAKIPIQGLDQFPVYPDYMLPRHLRHRGVLRYEDGLGARIDRRIPLEPGSLEEMAIRWATIRSAELVRVAVADRGVDLPTPDLDYWLWSESVLGPDAQAMGEHHRCITDAY